MRRSAVILFLLLALLGTVFPGGEARAQFGFPPDNEPKVHASLIPEQGEIRPGETVTVALREVIREHWHTYWVNPGDSGAPTTIEWQLPEGWSTGEIQWPYPKRLPVGPLMNYGYEDEVLLLFDMTAPTDAQPGESITIPASVGWLVCSDVCIPEDAELAITFTITDAPAPPGADTQALFAAARAKLPEPAEFAATYQADDEHLAMQFMNSAFVDTRPSDAMFFPLEDGFVEPAIPQKLRTVSGGIVLDTDSGWELADSEKRAGFGDVSGVLVVSDSSGATRGFALTLGPGIVATAVAVADMGILSAIAFAFLGGLILNLMPCVLPVLSMKALALANKSAVPAAARNEAMAYGLGVVLTFSLLAGVLLFLRAGGEAVGWGFQLQQPLVVAGLALLMFAVGLNLSGLYDVEAGRFAGVGQKFASKGGVAGSLFTGMLAVAVATPCTAPFMAAAIGYAATQSATVAFAVFISLALGFAMPFVLLGLSPGLLSMLPRPGPWMGTFKQVLAFPMFGAAAWLIWVLSQQTGPDGLFAIFAASLALAFALWAFGVARRSGGTGMLIGLSSAGLALVIMVMMTMRVGESTAAQTERARGGGTLSYEVFESARLAELRALGTPVFLNATAAWCITCLVNEQVALSSESLKEAFAANGIVAIKADWTNRNPEIGALLSEYGRNGVPLYLYFAPNAAQGRVLPQILTESIVMGAIQEAS